MTKSKYFPQKIFIEKDSLQFPLTKNILRKTVHIPFQVIENSRELIDKMQIEKDCIKEGKKYLLLTRQKGNFIKPCPCTPYYLGCNYYTINLDLNCPLDCSYCILQGYLNNPFLTVQVNKETLWKQLDNFLNRKRRRMFRMGTGELGDSLALDHITEHSKQLIPYFKKKKNAFLELKTKTLNIDNVLTLDPAENIVIAWSLNSPRIAEQEEKGVPPVKERIQAAQEVVKRGYRVAFHFDPLIFYPGWENEYSQVVEEVFTTVNHSKIAWISLGSLRFPPYLKEIIKERFPFSNIIYEELIKGKDGKFRYFKPIRKKMYKRIVEEINKRKKVLIPLYFCMESIDLWKEIMKKKPKDEVEVEKFLTSSFG